MRSGQQLPLTISQFGHDVTSPGEFSWWVWCPSVMAFGRPSDNPDLAGYASKSVTDSPRCVRARASTQLAIKPGGATNQMGPRGGRLARLVGRTRVVLAVVVAKLSPSGAPSRGRRIAPATPGPSRHDFGLRAPETLQASRGVRVVVQDAAESFVSNEVSGGASGCHGRAPSGAAWPRNRCGRWVVVVVLVLGQGAPCVAAVEDEDLVEQFATDAEPSTVR